MSTSHLVILCIIVLSFFPLYESQSTNVGAGSLNPKLCLKPATCSTKCNCCMGSPKKCFATKQECAAVCKAPPPKANKASPTKADKAPSPKANKAAPTKAAKASSPKASKGAASPTSI
ncbi:hypothetical protein AALP_AA6G324900 [Arabis alpina]|uniref:Uncharacterized protein n=1 Tax=Arabis alpina TaxID=50452 RepID=A0A087GT61_ARAAL|nr:hypothetical protein AALP_AA6G324900 [Arabis alpina]